MKRLCLVLVLLLVTTSCSVADSSRRNSAPQETSAAERAWDDLRWLMTALEAYAVDNNMAYAPAEGRFLGNVAELEALLAWYFDNTYPKKSTRPFIDPWGRPYQFVLSSARNNYALYSLGPDGKLGESESAFIERLRKNQLTAADLKTRRTSRVLIVASGTLLFAPEEITRSLKALE